MGRARAGLGVAVVGTLAASVSATMLIDSPRPEPAAAVSQGGGTLVGAIPAAAVRPGPTPAAPPPVTDLGLPAPQVSSERSLAEPRSAGADNDANVRRSSTSTARDDRSARRLPAATTGAPAARTARTQAQERAREQARAQIRAWAREWARDHQSRQQTHASAGDSAGRAPGHG